ncbi:uncharacterized protein TNIN_3621 [Trichonephila inaurata madagascariensis]|uniref:Uncharacterized protein n=1 Tax=Trichonephila inaurata madagascariensis TaxID=2747483 RepID=A0A8X7BQH1_9ARAC|nr:uncharacterized protein TNIN_3621 [Trichonephila inaurata madagascariensis]
MSQDQTIVFGNLGRHPNVLYEYISNNQPSLEVVVVSRHYFFPMNANDKICYASHIQAKNIKCDLLIYTEPIPYETIIKPDGVSTMVVFSSHLAIPLPDHWTKVCYFHYVDLTSTAENCYNCKTDRFSQTMLPKFKWFMYVCSVLDLPIRFQLFLKENIISF